MKSPVRHVASASTLLLASTLHGYSGSEDFNIADAEGAPFSAPSAAWAFVSGPTGNYTITVEADVGTFFTYGSSISPASVLGGDTTVHQGLPGDIEFTETSFSYRVTLPFWGFNTIERTTSIWGVNFTELQSDPDATYSAWYRFGGDEAPQIPFGGRIGSVTINFTWWY